MDTFRELTPEEIKLTTIQFMGQHLMGEMKELDRNIISKSNSLQGLTLRPEQIIESVGVSTPIPSPVNSANPGINVQPALAQQIQLSVSNTGMSTDAFYDPNQLEFDFNNCNYAKLIFDKLDSLEIKLDRLVGQLKK